MVTKDELIDALGIVLNKKGESADSLLDGLNNIQHQLGRIAETLKKLEQEYKFSK